MVLKNTCSLYLAVGTLLCAALVAESGVIKRAKNARCSDWQKTVCQPKKGNCGSGFQHGTRTGDCKGATERRFKCTVPCTGETTAVDRHVGRGGVPPSLEELESEVVGQSRRPAIRPGRGRQNGRKNNKKKQKGKKGGKNGKKGKRKACRYTRGALSACDPQVKLVTQTMTLRKGDPNECERNKTITRPCEGCKYGKSELTTRGDCDEATNTQTLTLTLTSGDPQNCAQTWTVTRKCKKNKGAKDDRKKRAKKEKRQQKKQEKKEKKKQKKEKRKEKKNKKQKKKECPYTKGTWSECDGNSEKRRVDTLIPDSQADCEPTKTLVKKCRVPDTNKCRYGERVASECVDGKVTITSNLISGPETCAQTKTTEKTCGKCIFDKWGDFGPCQNGVKTKKREVIQGGEKCQRKAVRMRKCKA